MAEAASSGGLSKRIRDRVGNPLDWSTADKCLALICLWLGVMIFVALLFFDLADHPERAPRLIDLEMGQKICLWVVAVLGPAWAILLALSLHLRRKAPETQSLAYATVFVWFTQEALAASSIGPLTTPNLMVFLGQAILAFMLFSPRVAAPGLAWALVATGAAVEASRHGIIPYAPMFKNPIQSAGRLDEWWYFNLGPAYLSVFLLFLTLLVFIIFRWREREEHVKQIADQLSDSLAELKHAQGQLVESEKMAALGGLVAGVAHEVNTPVGVAVTAASHLQERTDGLSRDFEAGRMKKSDLEKYLALARESAGMVLGNLNRASEIIQSFKQVAVDQSSEERRTFNLKSYLEDLLLSLRPQLKKTSHQVRLDIPDDLELFGYPGALSQIVTNLIMNSLIHGFEGRDDGRILIQASAEDGALRLEYRDDGRGIPRENLARIFDPFFTTRRGRGGSGLGMHIVYNLVTQTMGGRLEVESEPDQGARFIITLDPGQES